MSRTDFPRDGNAMSPYGSYLIQASHGRSVARIKILFFCATSVSLMAETQRHEKILFNSYVAWNTGYNDKDIILTTRAGCIMRTLSRTDFLPGCVLPRRIHLRVYLSTSILSCTGCAYVTRCKDTCIGHGRASSPRSPLGRSFA